ncbi:hypothetical protein PTSG_09205 [Salpingoeca rosetta]|uniref:Exportin-7/Ran-binding protein 17 TPR repeats domain-containing protein n=1 Tax=Salpingoeca rosetta (strain ATCC 50818 / BSB-021) TaxID=946362 RepID=F2UN08_SALR5|nr:uncharacterized protein PTSG_09205 [Salpingoeca rosetta]EGD78507.1 hypothetical protein PTSG_09205 [Salpingoeca rosetta]|eukprot:XP_004989456.1 hypothetical protein PTSG_09205 [Salpingoeca rosetta]
MSSGYIQQFELLCRELYDGQDRDQRQEAQQFILTLDSQPDALQNSKYIFQNTSLGYAQYVAAQTLTSIVSKPLSEVTVEQKLELKTWALQALFEAESQEPYVTTELCKLCGRITKLCWFETDGMDNYPFRTVMDDAMRFVDAGGYRLERGLQLLHFQVAEMNRPDNIQGLAKHRKVSSSFREEDLLNVFQLALTVLDKVVCKTADTADPAMLLGWVLQLCRGCLSYDFIGSCVDETTDDLKTVQVPSTWKETLTTNNMLPLFFELYLNLEPPLSSHALNCLVQLASIRRTIFATADDRMKYLGQLVDGLCRILQTEHGLKDGANYHEFCRLLARLKTTYQLSELVCLGRYRECLDYIARFTLLSLQSWDMASNRSADTLEDQLKQIATIARCQYNTSAGFLSETLQSCASTYVQTLQQGNTSDDKRLLEGQLSWLIHIIAGVIGARSSIVVCDDQDVYDAQLIAIALNLMQTMENARGGRGGGGGGGANVIGENLDLAFIFFLQELRAHYVGEQRHKSVRVQQLLNEQLNIENEMQLLDVIVQKIISNLRYCTNSEDVIRETLDLLSEFCTPFNAVRKLVRLDSVQFLLANHTSEHFPFLDYMEDTRLRTTYYQALGKVINHDFSAEDQRFERFMAPIGATADELARRILNAGPEAAQDHSAKRAILGLARDLRGLVTACVSKSSYMLMFDWIYPDRTPLFIKGVELWYDDPAVAVPCLKFMCEFVFSRNTRMSFGPSSPNGILLFRETSKMVVTYGERLLSLPTPPPDQLYRHRYKGIIACFNILRMALSGDYVNFGVFKLYGDPCLDEALGLFFRMLVTIPLSDIEQYPKLSKAFYGLFLYVTRDHSAYLSQLSPDVFRMVMMCVHSGVKSVISTISINSCTALDSMLTFVYTKSVTRVANKMKPIPEATALAQLLASVEDILLEILRDMFHVLMYENCKNQWSMSRPMLPLILFNPQHFQQIKEEAINGTPMSKRDLVASSFDGLLSEVEESLLVKNRDKFTQKISVFRRNLTTHVAPSPSSSVA